VRTSVPVQSPQPTYVTPVLKPGRTKNKFDIFAYCSKNYEDAYEFVIKSWTKLRSVENITIYTDWDLKSTNSKVEIIQMFEPSDDWIVGTGRRLDVIKHYSKSRRDSNRNVMFLDIDCYMVRDVEEVFDLDFDLGITRLDSRERYACKTATAGLWFARFTPGYFNFINDWFNLASKFKNRGHGIKRHHISYVQYSFTDIARRQTSSYKVLPLDEKVYNSEHTLDDHWMNLIKRHHPKILHFKGRRFRNKKLVNEVLNLAGKK